MKKVKPRRPKYEDGTYFWCRHHSDASTFIVYHNEKMWYMPGLGYGVREIEKSATVLGIVPRAVQGGGSIDQ